MDKKHLSEHELASIREQLKGNGHKVVSTVDYWIRTSMAIISFLVFMAGGIYGYYSLQSKTFSSVEMRTEAENLVQDAEANNYTFRQDGKIAQHLNNKGEYRHLSVKDEVNLLSNLKTLTQQVEALNKRLDKANL